MDNNRSPRSREILGPRPTQLKIRKNSHKIIKKPPLAPQLQPPPQVLHEQEPSQPQQQRGPVIIYTVSPKIIHTHPNNFMTLVQRLTGKPSTSTSSSSSTTNDISAPVDASRGSISPAARYAAMEKANTSSELGFVGETMDQQYYHHHHHHNNQNRLIERPSCYHGGILSPGPNSLPLVSPDFFSTVGPTDPQGLSSFFNDFNSILQASPSTATQSPSSMDLFNNFFES